MKKRGLRMFIVVPLINSIFIFFFIILLSYFLRGTAIITDIFSAFWNASVSFIVLCLFFRSKWFQGQVKKYKKIKCPIDLNEKYFQLEDETNEN